ncbi:MAG: hypothetical protein K2P74_04440 [Nitrosomonas sp.]|nr:hypothetical protein [Nitrosomonas sp.]
MWVDRNVVFDVLRKCSADKGISVSIENNEILIVCNGMPESLVLPEKVLRSLLQRISKRYGIKIEYFYHPDMIP